MVYRVYADAAVKNQEGYSSVAFLVLRGNTYLKSYKEIRYVRSSAIAESIAVGLALRYMVDEVGVTKEDTVNIFSDSKYTIQYSTKVQRCFMNNTWGSDECFRPFSRYWLLDIFDYIPKVSARLMFTKIRAHVGNRNPHCYVDRLAKVGLVVDK